MRRSLIILANSRKRGNRCIAGIDPETGYWVRPVYEAGEQGIPWAIRQIDGTEPGLLDIVSIPLATDGPHRDMQPENRRILQGTWKKVGEATVGQVARYCETRGLIFHNTDRRIHVSAVRLVSEDERRSLCLIRAHVAFSTEGTYRGKRVNAHFKRGRDEYLIPVTDYEYESQFPALATAEADCLLTVSLGLPYDQDSCCYKFVAGVIEL